MTSIKKRVLIVEDEISIQQLMSMALLTEGFEVACASDGSEALAKQESEYFDLIILDIMLPEVDGFDVCKHIRVQNEQIPILFLTARDSKEDRIKGLRLGGDDYLTKPFAVEELILRIKNLLRRSKIADEADVSTFKFGDYQIDFNNLEARGIQGEFKMTNIEAKLLRMFVEQKNQIISRKEILHYVWGYDVMPATRTIDNFILGLRKRFETDTRKPQYFHSIRGVGYKFTPNP